MWIFYLFFLAGAFLTGAFLGVGFLVEPVFFLVDLLLRFTGFFFLLLDFLPFFDFLDLLTGFFSSSLMIGEVVGYL
jgi:hypothetical protein